MNMNIKYRPHYKPTHSGFKGVYPEPRNKTKKWRAMARVLWHNGKKKQYHIGYFATPEEASKAYEDYIKEQNKKNVA